MVTPIADSGETRTAYTVINDIIAVLDGFTASGTFVPPCTYILGKTVGGDYYANNAYQTVYGGASDAGGVDGADAAAVLQAAIDDGGTSIMKKSWDAITGAINLINNMALFAEFGTSITYSGAAATTVFSNAVKPLLNCHVGGFTLDVNDVANVSPFVIDTPQKSTFSDLFITNAESKPAFTIKATSVGNNAYSNVFRKIDMYDVGGAFQFQGTASGTEVTLTRLDDIHAYHLHGTPAFAGDEYTGAGIGIDFKGWASGLLGTNVWLDLRDDGSKGVIWNNSATHDANTGDYDNSFVGLYIDTFGDANHANTTLLTFNNTKMNVIKKFFHSPPVDTFLGTCLNDQHGVSYWVEDVTSGSSEPAATQDLYIRVYNKGYMNNSLIADAMAIYANAATAYLSINDLYAAQDAQLILRTNDGSNREAIISMDNADGVLRINPATNKSVIIKLGDNAAATHLYIRDSDDADIVQITSDGDVKVFTDTKGVILKDRTLAAYYRIKLDNGVLGVEAV